MAFGNFVLNFLLASDRVPAKGIAVNVRGDNQRLVTTKKTRLDVIPLGQSILSFTLFW